MGVRTHKAEVRELLRKRDFDALIDWAGAVRSPPRVLFSLAFDDDELVVWRAIEAIGKLAGMQAKANIDRVRDSVRRLLWLMNDESGGLGWRSPELIGEILVNVPALIDEYAGLLPAFLREEPFQRGAHLAVSRTASVNSRPFRNCVKELSLSLDNSDAAIRCHAASALDSIDGEVYRPAIKKLTRDGSPVTLYRFDTGLLVNTTVGRVVSEVLG